MKIFFIKAYLHDDVSLSNISSAYQGPFSVSFGVSSDYAQPITGQVTEITCPVIDRAQPELTPSKRQKTGHDHLHQQCQLYYPLAYHIVYGLEAADGPISLI